MKSICILITLLTISLHSFCQDSTYYFSDVYEKGSIEFVANKIKFRIYNIDTSMRVCIIEKYSKRWIVTDTIKENYNRFYFEDINKDGFKDLVLSSGWDGKEAYLFNPSKKEFVYTGFFSWAYKEEMKLIDKQHSIYYDYEEYKYGRGKWFSYLFKIENYKRINLAMIYVDSYYSEKFGNYFVKEITISKINEKTDKTTIAKPKPIPKKHFNYASYWKLNWRKFLRK